MKVKCPISHVTYKTADLLGGSFTAPHPILSQTVTFKELKVTYLARWAAGTLDETDTHLLGTALLLKLPIEGKVEMPLVSPKNFHAFWQDHMERLAKTVEFLEGREFTHLPKLRIHNESITSLKSHLTTLMDAARSLWSPISEEARRRNTRLANDKTISLLELNSAIISSRSRAADGYDEIHEKDTVDEILNRGLKGSPLTRSEARKFPTLIANWAAEVGEFPTAMVTLESGKKVSIAQHWKGIIEQAFQKDAVVSILSSDVNIGDVTELLEHCYTEIPAGTLHASELFKKLEVLREVLDEFKSEGAPPKPAVFTGTQDDLLAAISGESTEVSVQISPKEDGLTAAQRLAVKMAALKAKKQGN